MSTNNSKNSTPETSNIQYLKANSLGLLGVLFMVVATAAPITAVTGAVPVSVGFGTGIGTPGGFLFAMAVLTIFSVGYVAMSRHIVSTGAFYGYISQGLGGVIGMASGLLTVVAYIALESAVAAIFASFASTTLHDQLGITLPWPVYALLFFVLVAILGHKDISFASKVLIILLISEISILTLMTISVFLHGGGPDGIPLSPINPVNAFKGAAPGLGLFFAFASWIGYESTAMYGEESRNPKKIIPRATYIAVIGIGIFYFVVSWAAIVGNGLQQSIEIAQKDPFALLFNPTQHFLGGWAVTVFQWLLITGSFAAGSAFHNAASRYLYAIGREGFINKNLGRTHPVYGSPYMASFIETIIAAVIVGLFWIAGQDPYLGAFTLLVLLGTVAILIVQTLCSFAVIGYFSKNHPESRHWFKTFLAPLLGGIAMFWVLILLIMNINTAAGDAASTLFFKLIPWIVASVFLAGIISAFYLRSKSPERYRAIGQIVLQDAHERADIEEVLPVSTVQSM
jgi:amino acid transporter